MLTAQTASSLVDLSQLVVDSEQYDAQSIVVTFRESAASMPAGSLGASTIAGQAISADGRSLGSAQRLMDGIYQVMLAPGVTVTDALAAYQLDSSVASAEPNYVVRVDTVPSDASFSQLWALNNTGQTRGKVDADIDAAEAWGITTGSGHFVVSVIDSGVDYSHPDLVNNIWVNPGEIAGNGLDDDRNGYVDDIVGWDFANNDNAPMDDNGHGTHVAGTIAAQGNDSLGVVGVTWRAKIMPLKFLSAKGSGYLANAVKALDYAVAMGAKLSNNSWGGGSSSSTMSAAIGRAQAAGHIFVAAAGNDGSNSDSQPAYPGAYPYDNIVSVAATDHRDLIASFSNHGATTVDIAAPGVSIYSTLPNNRYGSLSGTSMAAPHVTGAIALLWDKFPSLSYRQVIDLLLANVDKISGLSGKVASGGRLNVNAVLRAAGAVPAPDPPPPPTPEPPPTPISTSMALVNTADVLIRDLANASSSVTIGSQMTISDVNVIVSVQHGYVGQLQLTLVGPGNAGSINLAYRVGGSGANFNVTFDDEASSSVASGSAPFKGSYRPGEALSKFDGLDAYGTWTLQVHDYVQGTSGMIQAWALAAKGTVGGASAASRLGSEGTLPIDSPAASAESTIAGAAKLHAETRRLGSSDGRALRIQWQPAPELAAADRVFADPRLLVRRSDRAVADLRASLDAKLSMSAAWRV